MAADLVERADAAAAEHRTWFQQALRSGVKMALGSDILPLRESALLEMGLWVKDGATPWQTLASIFRPQVSRKISFFGVEIPTKSRSGCAALISRVISSASSSRK